MWPSESAEGPSGAATPNQQSNQELEDLKDQFEQQQLLINQLKEMLRKTEQTKVSHERVEEMATALTKMNARAKKNKNKRVSGDVQDVGNTKQTVTTPAKEKMNLLRQQLEENKARLAERGKSQKDIEEMVIQLKAQLDDSQNLISQSPLNVTQTDPKIDSCSSETSSEELYRILLAKEKRISELLLKIQKLEGTVLDLQENVKEKEQVIDARTKAITLMSENLSKKGKHTLDMLDETREQMRKMQENFVQLESNMETEKLRLSQELEKKYEEINELKVANEALLAENENYKQNKTTEKENEEHAEKIAELKNVISSMKSEENEEILKLKKQIDESNKAMIKVKAQNKSKIKELTKKIEAFKTAGENSTEILKLQNENIKLNETILNLQQEISDFRNDSALLERVKNLEENNKVLSEQLVQKEREIEEFKLKADVSASQVISAMDSITFEEQLDKMEASKKVILEERDNAVEENNILRDKLEQVKKEKNELSLKLEHYVQENMDLLDKLEKLSAEKVSSAESIEIVESLTQQEKMELEAYQKFIKNSQENLEQNVELNESVNQLTEETSELLQKIELFTVERREVMEKMETLAQEKAQLNLKLKETENNRDVLVETYEQLQNEKEELIRKLQEFQNEHTILKDTLAVFEQENEQLRNRIVEFENKDLNSEKNSIEASQNEIDHLNSVISHLNGRINELECENKVMIDNCAVLDDLKQSLQENITQIQSYENKIAQNSFTIEELNEALLAMQQDVYSKDDEINKLLKVKENLEKELTTKNDNFHATFGELKKKYEKMAKQIEQNSDCIENIKKPLEAKIDDLTNKNREQLEKMKKIAANLKKKSSEYQVLEEKYIEIKEKWENENTEKENLKVVLEKRDLEVMELNVKLESLMQQLQEVENELNVVKNQFAQKGQEYTTLLEQFDAFKTQNENEYKNQISMLTSEIEVLKSQQTDMRFKDEEIAQLKEQLEQFQLNSTENLGILQNKIAKYKERLRTFENCLKILEEKRLRLKEKIFNVPICDIEGELEERLDELIVLDETIEKHLCEMITENKQIATENLELKANISKIENENSELMKHVCELEGQLECVQTKKDEVDGKIKNTQEELKVLIEEKNDLLKHIEDLSNQISEYKAEGIHLKTEIEKLQEKNKIESEKKSEINIEELQEKIRALEFMLYNTEKEKDEAVLQCHQLSNELTSILYEKDQLLQKQDIASTTLHNLEFEASKPIQQQKGLDDPLPVVEDVCTKKTAYLCYDDDEGKKDTNAVQESSVFNENDDGWAWGPEEARLEEEHHRNSPKQNDIIPQLREKIQILELERERHLEEIKQVQIKSGKLIKKLKELKTKNEQLSAQLYTNASSLDDTMQNEFKCQIDSLEKKAKELSCDLAKEKLEKENLKKQIDVLTAANARMIEMKEKQEIEILSWKERSRELERKLEQFDWGDDGGLEPTQQQQINRECNDENTEQLQQHIKELNETIKELSLDNDELQALLEEQRNMRITADSHGDKENLAKQLSLTLEEKKKLQDELNILTQKTDALMFNFEKLYSDKQKLEILILERNELEKTFDYMKNQYDSIVKESVDFNHELLNKLHNVEENNDRLNQLRSDVEKMNGELAEKKEEISQLTDSFSNQIAVLKTQLDDRNETIQQLQLENERLLTHINEKDSELMKLDEKYKIEYETKHLKSVEDLTSEWMRQVDQRGADVAESWKLHLETRENEFMQVEKQLRSEIYELEEKCNALVNENNELRKNVDTEIKNEVDRIAALQQQINEKHNIINELSRNLVEKDGVIEQLQEQLAQTQVNLNELQERLHNEELKITDYETSLTIKNEELLRNQELINELSDKLKKEVANETQKIALEECESELQLLQNQLYEKECKLSQANVMIEDCNVKIEQLQSNCAILQQNLEDKNRVIEQLNDKLNQIQIDNKQIVELQEQLTALNDSLQEKQNIIQTREDTIKGLHDYIELKEQNIREFNVQTAELEHLHEEVRILKGRLIETTEQYEELLSNKNVELESLKSEIEEQTKNYKQLFSEIENVREKLKEKTNECNEMNDRQRQETADLHKLIEDQVLRIEQLNKLLSEKSEDYDALNAELDIAKKQKLEKYDPPAVYHDTEDDNLLEPVSRAELDLALYMLHQRDVRCEELTMELMQLLEERDTLQLRLSNAIREKEELRSSAATELPSSIVKEGDVASQDYFSHKAGSSSNSSKTSAFDLPATGSELAVEAVGSDKQLDTLANKLSELKSVGYRKDKTLVDEKELRRLQELSIMQQHKDIAAKLPPEAAAKLVDANYTLSRDVQSPSKVLLNWLWGKSTPKVNNV